MRNISLKLFEKEIQWMWFKDVSILSDLRDFFGRALV